MTLVTGWTAVTFTDCVFMTTCVPEEEGGGEEVGDGWT